MPLVRVSERTKNEIERIKKRGGYGSENMVVWKGIKKLKSSRRSIIQPTLDWDVFGNAEDFTL